MNGENVPSTIIAAVTFADAVSGVYAIVYNNQPYEATDPNAVAPAVGEVVLADYLPGSWQWIIVAKL